MPPISLYWHDYETFGADPRLDRPVQFAGMRTDENLEIVGNPLEVYCRPTCDRLPSPDACLITGITPQMAADKGVPEAKFIAAIHQQLAWPGTCGLGYNTLRFDDEVTRHCLYRNFYDPYEREWKNGNSRWDLIDVVRLTAALRPEGIEWPKDEQGRPSFRLERLTAANGIVHQGAHDALVDVRATIELARLIRQRQPKLYDFLWRHRGKREVAELLQLGSDQPVLHVSEKYSAERHCIAVVVALARHPVNQNGVIVYDLSSDPQPLLEIDAEAIRERLFTPVAELPEGVARIPLKTVHLNKCPVVVPLKTLRPQDAERLNIDLVRCNRHLQMLQDSVGILEKLQQVFGTSPMESPEENDPETMLYRGGFFSDADKREMARVRESSPAALSQDEFRFDDRRLPELLFRYRARSFPETLSLEEEQRWQNHCRRRMLAQEKDGRSHLEAYRARLQELQLTQQLTDSRREILASLETYGQEIVAELALEDGNGFRVNPPAKASE